MSKLSHFRNNDKLFFALGIHSTFNVLRDIQEVLCELKKIHFAPFSVPARLHEDFLFYVIFSLRYLQNETDLSISNLQEPSMILSPSMLVTSTTSQESVTSRQRSNSVSEMNEDKIFNIGIKDLPMRKVKLPSLERPLPKRKLFKKNSLENCEYHRQYSRLIRLIVDVVSSTGGRRRSKSPAISKRVQFPGRKNRIQPIKVPVSFRSTLEKARPLQMPPTRPPKLGKDIRQQTDNRTLHHPFRGKRLL